VVTVALSRPPFPQTQAQADSNECAAILLRAGARVNATSLTGDTALHIAASNGLGSVGSLSVCSSLHCCCFLSRLHTKSAFNGFGAELPSSPSPSPTAHPTPQPTPPHPSPPALDCWLLAWTTTHRPHTPKRTTTNSRGYVRQISHVVSTLVNSLTLLCMTCRDTGPLRCVCMHACVCVVHGQMLPVGATWVPWQT
jgi:hypothetical protein